MQRITKEEKKAGNNLSQGDRIFYIDSAKTEFTGVVTEVNYGKNVTVCWDLDNSTTTVHWVKRNYLSKVSPTKERKKSASAGKVR